MPRKSRPFLKEPWVTLLSLLVEMAERLFVSLIDKKRMSLMLFNQRMDWKSIIFFSLFFCSVSIQAGLFQITNRTGTCSVACDVLENQVNSNLPEADQSNYLQGMANSSVISQKGLGASYGTNIEFIEVGFTGALGADLGNNSTGDLIGGDVDYNQVRGIGIGGAVSLGLKGSLFGSKFGPFDMSRTSFYGYFLNMDPPDTDGLGGETTSLGFHVQYKIIPEVSLGPGLLSWGGVDFTFGFERASMSLQFIETLNETVSESGATASFTGQATVGADVTTYTIPFELSTNARLFYVFSTFAGLGADLSFGKAKSIATLTGDVSVTGGGTGDAQLDLGTEESPDTFAFRGFIGIQANLTALNTFLLVNKGFTNGTLGLALGVRLAF